MSVSLSNIGQVAVPVKNLERALAFYRDVLGVPFLFKAGDRLAFFDCNGVRLMLDIPDPEFDHPNSILYFKVGDIQAAHRELRAKSVRFRDEPQVIAEMPDHVLWMAFFYDTESNVMALMAEAPR
ncbi:MAG: VOC family protein [Dehalococcoidia bacterium]|nr:VOC family protein [Dehalococcoidia bacterium]